MYTIVHYTKFMAQFEFIQWLALWLIETLEFDFEWDHGNSVKNLKKHGVSQDQAESVFLGRNIVPLGLQVKPIVLDEARFGVVGTDSADELLMVVFTIRNGKVRIISAKPAQKKEKEYYEKIRS